MKFALASYGSRGDVEPFAAVGRELRRRGHDVCMAAPPHMLGIVESAGLAPVAYGPSPQAHHAQNPLAMIGELMDHVSQALAASGATLTRLAEDADLLLTGTSEQGLAANVAERFGIPLATLHFFPAPVSASGLPFDDLTAQADEAQRRALGLPAGQPARGPSLEIQAYDKLCFPDLAAEWARGGNRRPFVGALTLELPTEADDEVLAWIAGGTPPIYFGFGSSVRLAAAADTVAVIGEACAQLGERALICSGASEFSEIPQFEHVKIADTVNHGAVLPACRAVVHHGGAGTTAAGMRAGVPALILWRWLDQPIWADVVTRLKIGSGHQLSDTTLESLVADLRSLLTPQCIARAREVATQLTTPDESVALAADLLEDTANAAGVPAESRSR
ncbi:glycosyltransferase [Mycobacterium branderi]|uniref:Glycosyltransferase n=1 Tax=Mycobacterium branderi TaxID=43348 RepID=A0A7I7WD82_9MYCO|nr:glycosyltransferase [Mycobacterium branderi]MCV7234099.1 glycosyltransferase [Mycobacterium branderi]ORA32223.1 glycosyltransferase [Mycobacterium branderi]BBZ13818.1 putative glycosyltransferase [Mycobacterium branderi]